LISVRIAAALVLAVGPAFSACSPTASQLRGEKPGDTQVVVQWPLGVTARVKKGVGELFALNRYFQSERAVEKASGGLYFEDGNDVGGGLFNVYLYTSDVEGTVGRVVALENAGRIPAGVQIGVAVYKDGSRNNWSYRPAYPDGLKSFSVF
jgi:hypothetical protein